MTQLISVVSLIINFVTSSVYHQYMVLGRRYYKELLRLDLIGIGFSIFGNAICITYLAVHNFEKM